MVNIRQHTYTATMGKIIHRWQGKYQERAHRDKYEIMKETEASVLLICSLNFFTINKLATLSINVYKSAGCAFTAESYK